MLQAADSITDTPTRGSQTRERTAAGASVPFRRLVGATVIKFNESSSLGSETVDPAISSKADDYSRDPGGVDNIPVGKAAGIENARRLIEAAHAEAERNNAALPDSTPQ